MRITTASADCTQLFQHDAGSGIITSAVRHSHANDFHHVDSNAVAATSRLREEPGALGQPDWDWHQRLTDVSGIRPQERVLAAPFGTTSKEKRPLLKLSGIHVNQAAPAVVVIT